MLMSQKAHLSHHDRGGTACHVWAQIRWACDENAGFNCTLVQPQAGISSDKRLVNARRQMRACCTYCDHLISCLPGLWESVGISSVIVKLLNSLRMRRELSSCINEIKCRRGCLKSDNRFKQSHNLVGGTEHDTITQQDHWLLLYVQIIPVLSAIEFPSCFICFQELICLWKWTLIVVLKFHGAQIPDHSLFCTIDCFSQKCPSLFLEGCASNTLHSTLRFPLENQLKTKEIGGYIFLASWLFSPCLAKTLSKPVSIHYVFFLSA